MRIPKRQTPKRQRPPRTEAEAKRQIAEFTESRKATLERLARL